MRRSMTSNLSFNQFSAIANFTIIQQELGTNDVLIANMFTLFLYESVLKRCPRCDGDITVSTFVFVASWHCV